MIIFDENVDQFFIKQLKKKNYDFISIRELHPGISDNEVIEITKSYKGLLITEDKDFGELVFSHNISDCSVILLRYNKQDYEKISNNIIDVLEKYYQKPNHYFIAITKNKIRIRKI